MNRFGFRICAEPRCHDLFIILRRSDWICWSSDDKLSNWAVISQLTFRRLQCKPLQINLPTLRRAPYLLWNYVRLKTPVGYISKPCARPVRASGLPMSPWLPGKGKEEVHFRCLNFRKSLFFILELQNRVKYIPQFLKPCILRPWYGYERFWRQFCLFHFYLFWLNICKIIVNHIKFIK